MEDPLGAVHSQNLQQAGSGRSRWGVLNRGRRSCQGHLCLAMGPDIPLTHNPSGDPWLHDGASGAPVRKMGEYGGHAQEDLRIPVCCLESTL